MFEFSDVKSEQLLHDVSRQDRITSWDHYFLAMAFLAARKSKDPSTKTGCVIMRDRQILTTGYNSFARGCDDSPHLYEDKAYKYANIVHCDHNAVLQGSRVGVSLLGATMYLTGPPCSSCTQSIINAGIIEVVWPVKNKFECTAETKATWEKDLIQAQKNLDQAGVVWSRWAPETGRTRG